MRLFLPQRRRQLYLHTTSYILCSRIHEHKIWFKEGPNFSNILFQMMKKQLWFCSSKCPGKYDGLRAFITHEVGVQTCKNIDNYHQRTFCLGKMAPKKPKFGIKFAKQTLSLQNQDEYIRTICAFLRPLGQSRESTHGEEIQYGFVSPIPAKEIIPQNKTNHSIQEQQELQKGCC